jgi:hypothetical protein
MSEMITPDFKNNKAKRYVNINKAVWRTNGGTQNVLKQSDLNKTGKRPKIIFDLKLLMIVYPGFGE